MSTGNNLSFKISIYEEKTQSHFSLILSTIQSNSE